MTAGQRRKLPPLDRFDVPEPGAPDELERLRDLVVHVERLLASQPMIEQAKGILIATEGCTGDDAFGLLRTTSQRLNIPVREVARRLVARYERRQVIERSRAVRERSQWLIDRAQLRRHGPAAPAPDGPAPPASDGAASDGAASSPV